MSFLDNGKETPPASSESLIQKLDQIQEKLTFMLHVGHTQSVYFSPYVFDGSDHIEQIVKNMYEAANVYYVDVAQQACLTKMVFMGEELRKELRYALFQVSESGPGSFWRKPSSGWSGEKMYGYVYGV